MTLRTLGACALSCAFGALLLGSPTLSLPALAASPPTAATLPAARQPAPAQPLAQDEPWCRNGAFPSEDTDHRIARVRSGTDAVRTRDDRPECLVDAPPASCTSALTIPTGEPLIAGRTFGDFTCVWAEGPQHELVGYVPTSALQLDGEDDLLGTWGDGANSLEITRAADGGLRVQGEARWLGLVVAGERVVHFGQVDAPARLLGTRLVADDGSCIVSIKRVGRALVAHDNRSCGGANVTFDGVYHPRPKTADLPAPPIP